MYDRHKCTGLMGQQWCLFSLRGIIKFKAVNVYVPRLNNNIQQHLTAFSVAHWIVPQLIVPQCYSQSYSTCYSLSALHSYH